MFVLISSLFLIDSVFCSDVKRNIEFGWPRFWTLAKIGQGVRYEQRVNVLHRGAKITHQLAIELNEIRPTLHFKLTPPLIKITKSNNYPIHDAVFVKIVTRNNSSSYCLRISKAAMYILNLLQNYTDTSNIGEYAIKCWCKK